jgi:metal-dependent hydrolase (beta-lactamase superfamily II)
MRVKSRIENEGFMCLVIDLHWFDVADYGCVLLEKVKELGCQIAARDIVFLSQHADKAWADRLIETFGIVEEQVLYRKKDAYKKVVKWFA